MPGHPALVVEPVQREQHRVVADGLIEIAAGEHVPASAADGANFAQQLDGLTRQRYDVFVFYLHARSRNNPRAGVQVDFIPCRADQLAGANERQRQ